MNILKFLDDRKMTQQELGDSLGTSNQNVNRWVTGKGFPSYEICQKLFSMGITVEELFDVNYNEMHGLQIAETEPPKLTNEEFMKQFESAMMEWQKRNPGVILTDDQKRNVNFNRHPKNDE